MAENGSFGESLPQQPSPSAVFEQCLIKTIRLESLKERDGFPLPGRFSARAVELLQQIQQGDGAILAMLALSSHEVEALNGYQREHLFEDLPEIAQSLRDSRYATRVIAALERIKQGEDPTQFERMMHF